MIKLAKSIQLFLRDVVQGACTRLAKLPMKERAAQSQDQTHMLIRMVEEYLGVEIDYSLAYSNSMVSGVVIEHIRPDPERTRDYAEEIRGFAQEIPSLQLLIRHHDEGRVTWTRMLASMVLTLVAEQSTIRGANAELRKMIEPFAYDAALGRHIQRRYILHDVRLPDCQTP